LTTIKIGTRTSTLAMWQAKKVSQMLNDNGISTEIIGISSKGDQSLSGDLASSVGQFIHAIDAKLVDGTVDISVHSSKDVPVDFSDSINGLALLERGSTNDLLIFPKREDLPSLSEVLKSSDSTDIETALSFIPHTGMVGTVSGRRQSFLLSSRPDVIPIAVRGQIETRLKRLFQKRVDAIILAEVGLQRLNSIDALDSWMLEFSAIRLDDFQWPTAPGQGAISVHYLSSNSSNLIPSIRDALNHKKTEDDVVNERKLLREIGGGCLYPAGIKVDGSDVALQISPHNWRETFCQGRDFPTNKYHGNLSSVNLELPETQPGPSFTIRKGPKLISTLNSDRLANILQNDGINVLNKPVISLVPKSENWPKLFIDDTVPRSQWPYLVLTSPFAAKCAIKVAQENGDINRIQWLAIGEGTARACFKRGVTVSICAKARNSKELADYIENNIENTTKLMLPRSDVAPEYLLKRLTESGFEVECWVGYENKSKILESFVVNPDDVLLLSSPSSARSWFENSLPIPKNILCMGKSSLVEIESMDYFADSEVEILKGPTAEFLSKWWKASRGEQNED